MPRNEASPVEASLVGPDEGVVDKHKRLVIHCLNNYVLCVQYILSKITKLRICIFKPQKNSFIQGVIVNFLRRDRKSSLNCLNLPAEHSTWTQLNCPKLNYDIKNYS